MRKHETYVSLKDEVAQNHCSCGWSGPTWINSWPEKSAEMQVEALTHRFNELEKIVEMCTW